MNFKCCMAFGAICSASSIGGGFRLRLYVPYGDAWYPYFMRRLAERPANVLFLAKNLLRN